MKKENGAMKTNPSDSLSAEFLLTEYNALQDRARSLEEIKSGRLNFFLLVVGAAIAGLSNLYNGGPFVSVYRIGVLVSVLVLFLLGILTLKSAVDYSMAIVVLYRRAGRIRRWFVDRDETISRYVAFEPADDRPRMSMPSSFFAWRGGEPVLVVINMVSAGVLVGAGLSFIRNDILPWAGMGVTALLTWILQNLYIAKKLDKGERLEEKRVMFPFRPDSGE